MRQRAEEVDIRRELRLRPAGLFGQRGIVQRRIAVGIRQKIILVRNDGEVDLGVRSGHKVLIEGPEAVGGVGNGVLIQRVFQLGGIAVRKVDAVVVLLTAEIQPRQRFQGAELLPQGELVGGVVLITGHEFARRERELTDSSGSCASGRRSLRERSSAGFSRRPCARSPAERRRQETSG